MKKQLRSLICILLALVLLAGMLPVQSRAVMLQKPSREDLILREPQITVRGSTSGIRREADEYERDWAVLIEAIRENLVARQTGFTLYYQADYLMTQTDMDALFEEPYAETGNAWEGDYLRYCSYLIELTLNYMVIDGIYYYELNFGTECFSTAQQEQDVTARVQEIMNGFGFTEATSDYVKIRTVYDYICSNVRYDYKDYGPGDYSKHTAYAALFRGEAVCQGYALLLYRMLREADISCRVITGYAGEGHAWNIARLDGLYYNLDSTWDEGGRHDYFLKCGDSFDPDHSRDPRFDTQQFHDAYPMAQADYVPQVLVEGDFTYTPWGEGLAVEKYTGTAAEVTIPAQALGKDVVAIGGSAFAGNETVTSVAVPATVTEILDGTYSWETDVIGAFSYCSALETVTFAPGNQLHTFGEWAFYDCKALRNMELPATLRSLELSSLEGCSAITELVLPEGLKCIKQNAVGGLGVTVLEIPASCTEISFFNNSESLQEFRVAEGNPVYDAQDGVVFKKGWEGDTLWLYPLGKTDPVYHMPDRVKVFDAMWFGASLCANKHLQKVVFTDQQITGPGRLRCEVEVSESNPYHKVEGGLLYSKDGTVLQSVPSTVTGTLVVPEGVIALEEYAAERGNYEAVVLPDSLRAIGAAAFWETPTLKTVTMGSHVAEIGDSAFQACPLLESIVIPEGVTVLYFNVLGFCYGLKTVALPSTLTYVEPQAFAHCYGLETVYYNGTQEQFDAIVIDPFANEPLLNAQKVFETRLEGWQERDGIWYYYRDGRAQTGWQKLDGKLYYFREDGSWFTATGWQRINGNWYWFGSDSVARTNWQKVSGKWYYLGSDGVMRTGWQKVSGKWYYLGTSGAMTTGWQRIGGSWYYMDGSGIMQTGWVKVSGKWYYLSSDMKTGWQQIGGKWYYMDGNGVMQTGWEKIDGKWYFFSSGGVMQRGWRQINGKWYFLYNDMKTGWVNTSGSWYYLDENGIMVYGCTMEIDGETYTFDENGVMLSKEP